MNITRITIAGKEFPVSFGKAALAAFEGETGIAISSIGDTTPYLNTLRLIFYGLKDGYRKEKRPFNHSFEDVCDLLDEDEDAMTRLLAAFEASVPKAEEGEKKATAAGGKVKK